MLIKKVVSGIQPSGNLHLGNFLGAVKQWKDLLNKPEYSLIQNRQKTLFFLADLHTLTSRLAFKDGTMPHFSQENMDSLTLNTLACLILINVLYFFNHQYLNIVNYIGY